MVLWQLGLLATLMSVVGSVINNNTADSNLFDLLAQPNDTEELLEQYGRLVLASMNRSINPCENFYDYACGGWKDTPLLPPEIRNDSLLHAMQQRIDNKILGFLQNATSEELNDRNTTSAERKAKQFYLSCTAMKTNVSIGYKHLMEYKDDRYEGQRLNETVDWIRINFMSKFEVFPLLPLKINYNTATRKFDIHLSAPRKILGSVSEATLQNMTRDFGIGEGAARGQFLELFRNSTQFERNLTELATVRNETQHLTLLEFTEQHKNDRLNWTRCFELAFNGTQQPHWQVHNQLNSVGALVHFLERTPLSILHDYQRIRVLLKFYATWQTQSVDKSVARVCRAHVENYYNYALLPWFIGSVFDKDRRADILTVAKHIKDTFYDLLADYTWLDDETRSEARTKLASMDVLVGYSDDLQHRELIDEVYAGVSMTGNWYEDLIILEANRARVRSKSVDKALIPLLMPTRTVNAYYADFLNLAFVTIGLAQFPFYHKEFPPVFKYAGIGNIIGHEMAHGFDSYCYQFNYDGKKINWWSSKSLRNFKERYRCLESQYNKFILMGVATNGSLTSGDNIADNVGARMAYYAFQRHIGKNTMQVKPMHDLNFTNQQLFFLKFAQSWCTGKDNKASKLKKLKTDVHAYEEFRVVGTLSNMPEFSEAFGCKLGTEMNPLKKCVVW